MVVANRLRTRGELSRSVGVEQPASGQVLGYAEPELAVELAAAIRRELGDTILGMGVVRERKPLIFLNDCVMTNSLAGRRAGRPLHP